MTSPLVIGYILLLNRTIVPFDLNAYIPHAEAILRTLLQDAMGDAYPLEFIRYVTDDDADGNIVLVNPNDNNSLVTDATRAKLVLVYTSADILNKYDPLTTLGEKLFTFHATHHFLLFVDTTDGPLIDVDTSLFLKLERYRPQHGSAVINITMKRTTNGKYKFTLIKDGPSTQDAIPRLKKALMQAYPSLKGRSWIFLLVLLLVIVLVIGAVFFVLKRS